MTSFGSLPRAVISLSALSAAAQAAVDAGGEVADLRADAFGHGARRIARTLHDAGVRRVVVDDDVVATDLAADGIDAVVGAEPDIDSNVLYGLPGSGLMPAMRLGGRMLSLKPLRTGEAVSYGYTHRAEVDTTIALVTGGYAQGIVRALGNTARVEIAGMLHPIVGRVAMDVCVVDLQQPDVSVLPAGEAVYFGGAGPARDALSIWSRVTSMRATELVAVAGAKAVREWAA